MLPRFLHTAPRTLTTLHRARQMSTFTRLVRFEPKSGSPAGPLIGQPVDPEQDVGLASYAGEAIKVELYSGTSVLAPGEKTGEQAEVGRLLSPLAKSEVGMIRCIGLNYLNHAHEVKMEIPKVPVLFAKPATSLADPFPAPTVLPKAFAKEDTFDYESELAIVIGKDAKDVSEADALDYLLGFTASNDVSSRAQQFAQSQWCYSKGFDGSAPIGPAFVHKSQVPQLADLQIRGQLNGNTVQQSGLDDLIFPVAKIISFLSQGTTLPAGTLILTGTPAGVGWSAQPQRLLRDGDEFRVFVSHGVGTLINKIELEK